jgi:hypothetical protein
MKVGGEVRPISGSCSIFHILDFSRSHNDFELKECAVNWDTVPGFRANISEADIRSIEARDDLRPKTDTGIYRHGITINTL